MSFPPESLAILRCDGESPAIAILFGDGDVCDRKMRRLQLRVLVLSGVEGGRPTEQKRNFL